jgi:hypothetical protein
MTLPSLFVPANERTPAFVPCSLSVSGNRTAGDYSGAAFYPNITPDLQTGIGPWTDPEIAAALRDGLFIDGTSLCSLMERFPLSYQQTADVIA